tara:strand:+ start:191 stop:883 length:693 start_codon:yes stop_codon:yes gene_type:complete
MGVEFLILGDSHVQVFSHANHFQEDVNFEVVTVHGASAQGAINPNNSTDSVKIFSEKLDEIRQNGEEYDFVGVMLGEVDCGFIIWHLFEEHGIPIDYQLKNSVKALFSFISSDVERDFPSDRIFVFGSALPTITDGEDVRVPNRGDVSASQLERTELTQRYNAKLRDICQERNYRFVEITDHTLNQETKVVDEFFRWPTPGNHHLDNRKTWKLWFNKIAENIGIDPIIDQ